MDLCMDKGPMQQVIKTVSFINSIDHLQLVQQQIKTITSSNVYRCVSVFYPPLQTSSITRSQIFTNVHNTAGCEGELKLKVFD